MALVIAVLIVEGFVEGFDGNRTFEGRTFKERLLPLLRAPRFYFRILVTYCKRIMYKEIVFNKKNIYIK